MSKVSIVKPEDFGYKFIDDNFLPEGKDEYYLRFAQNHGKRRNYRPLTFEEVGHLIKNGNSCSNWNDILVEDPFAPALIKNNFFAGLVRIASSEEMFLRYNDFVVPVGITGSKIISCDIGSNCAVHYCAYLSHYIIGNNVILSRIDEMSTTNHAKFGEGLVKDGEDEKVRIKIQTINEAGGRDVFPFSGMITADAFMWAKYRGDSKLINRLEEITQNSADTRRGYYGTVGNECIIKSCRIIKDVKFGEAAYVKGANKLKNLTINSSEEEPSQIGEGVELVNGIIGHGSRIFYGAKAVRFVIGSNCELKYGARLIHSILGDNSTISCCEVLNSLLFPYHEQHHNNSFLIASVVKGQSNMAAGATVGSNHNTRGNDGEIEAGRGFWPGLSSTLKHNCRFASFVLISKGNYNYEMDIPFPFSLVMDNARENRLEIMPAYYWLYNMYALERNNKKFLKRDRRKTKVQKIETDYLAPDTASEIIHAMDLLKAAIIKAWEKSGKPSVPFEEIINNKEELNSVSVEIENIERSKRTVKIIKAAEAFYAYSRMLIWYGVKTLAAYFYENKTDFNSFSAGFKETGQEWINLGGQLIQKEDFHLLTEKIKSGDLNSWNEIHREYEKNYSKYREKKAENAYFILCRLKNKKITAQDWNSFLSEAVKIRKYIEEQIYFTKKKDYANAFRGITYEDKAEQDAVLGSVEDNPLIKEAEEETEYFLTLFKKAEV